MLDGKAVPRVVMVEKTRPLFDRLPLYDADGEPVMIGGLPERVRRDDKGEIVIDPGKGEPLVASPPSLCTRVSTRSRA